jgi:WD40 repeat protein
MHSLHKGGNYKLECAFTSNDKYVVSGSECGAMVAYFVHDPTQAATLLHEESKGVKLQRHTAPTCSVAACPQSSRPWLVLSASYDGSAVVWASYDEANHCIED